jgi:broad specificity phosphatase PhoE
MRSTAPTWIAAFTGFCALLAAGSPAFALSEAAIAALKQGGHVILMRHAQTTPGAGDPPNFRLGDCATQRNLSEEGRADARRFGEALRRNGIAIGGVLSSAWCRCVDTARLALPEQAVAVEESLNSFFQGGEAERRRSTQAARAKIAAWSGPGNVLMVTHQVNITALTGRVPAQGAMLILKPKPGGFDIVAESRS